MATVAQAAAGAFLAMLSSSSTRHTAPSSVSFLASPVLPTSLRSAGTAGPLLASRYRGRRVAAVISQLPTTHPEVAAGDKKIRWSSRAVRSFAMAELEARKMRYPTTGSEGLLMGILVEGTSGAAKLLRANGITLLKVREEAANVLGKSEMFYFSPMHPPLTEAAQRALDWAVSEKMKSGVYHDTEYDLLNSTSTLCQPLLLPKGVIGCLPNLARMGNATPSRDEPGLAHAGPPCLDVFLHRTRLVYDDIW